LGKRKNYKNPISKFAYTQKKVPKQTQKVKGKKEAIIADQNNPEFFIKKNPIWKLDLFDLSGPWGLKKIDSVRVLKNLHKKLKNYSTRTWGEIISDNNNNAYVPVIKFIKNAQKRLVKLELNDHDELFHFRFSGKERLWGFRKSNDFYIIWWDPYHEICPENK